MGGIYYKFLGGWPIGSVVRLVVNNHVVLSNTDHGYQAHPKPCKEILQERGSPNFQLCSSSGNQHQESSYCDTVGQQLLRVIPVLRAPFI